MEKRCVRMRRGMRRELVEKEEMEKEEGEEGKEEDEEEEGDEKRGVNTVKVLVSMTISSPCIVYKETYQA